jgi:glycyl-tRNA synthetase beta subunit
MDVEKLNSDFKKDYEVVNGIISILSEFHQLNPAIHLFQKFVFVLDANFVLRDIRHSLLNKRYTYLQFCLKN